MVGGEIEDGETPQEAAIREALEEADLDLSHARFSEVMEFPQIRGPRGPYVQYVLEAVVKPELIERHRTGLVDTTDAEGQKHESTAFRLESVLGMKDFMPKHANFLRALSREVQAA
jgi:ADP-ribose pyrophosphatase YjhB (NUDIX family)